MSKVPERRGSRQPAPKIAVRVGVTGTLIAAGMIISGVLVSSGLLIFGGAVIFLLMLAVGRWARRN